VQKYANRVNHYWTGPKADKVLLWRIFFFLLFFPLLMTAEGAGQNHNLAIYLFVCFICPV